MATNSTEKAGLLMPKKHHQDIELTNLERTSNILMQSEPKSEKKVAVVYYLTRYGQLEHPHFIEVSLSSPQGLQLTVTFRRNFFFLKLCCKFKIPLAFYCCILCYICCIIYLFASKGANVSTQTDDNRRVKVYAKEVVEHQGLSNKELATKEVPPHFSKSCSSLSSGMKRSIEDHRSAVMRYQTVANGRSNGRMKAAVPLMKLIGCG